MSKPFCEKALPKTKKPKIDSPRNYHSFLTSYKVFQSLCYYGYGFLVELECKHTLEFADTTGREKELQKIFCPQCRCYREILRYRRIEIK